MRRMKTVKRKRCSNPLYRHNTVPCFLSWPHVLFFNCFYFCRRVKNVIRPERVDENTGSFTTEPLSNIRLSPPEGWMLESNNWAGRGQIQALFPRSPRLAPWVNKKDLVTRPCLHPLAWSLHPSILLPPYHCTSTRRPHHRALHHAFQQLRRQSPPDCPHSGKTANRTIWFAANYHAASHIVSILFLREKKIK